MLLFWPYKYTHWDTNHKHFIACQNTLTVCVLSLNMADVGEKYSHLVYVFVYFSPALHMWFSGTTHPVVLSNVRLDTHTHTHWPRQNQTRLHTNNMPGIKHNISQPWKTGMEGPVRDVWSLVCINYAFMAVEWEAED